MPKRKTVLLVDDDDAVSLTIKIVLQRNGYQVLVAKSGLEALRLVEENPPRIDLLLADITLPGDINGPKLSEMLRAQRPELKVIFSTGHDIDTIAGELMMKEGVNFLQKPFETSILLQTIRNALEQK